MKKICTVLLLCLAGVGVFAQNIGLDEAIRISAQEMGQRLPQGATVAVLSFTSNSDRLSRYVIDELNNAIVNDGRLTVADRQRQDEVMQELTFQESGLVGEDSVQKAGRALGAQFVVSGSMELVAGAYRFIVQALLVEGMTIQYSGTKNVINDNTVRLLAGGDDVIRDFTPEEQKRAKSLNFLWGAGSFRQGDILGGTVTALLDTGGLTVFIIGVVNLAGAIPEPGYINNDVSFAGKHYTNINDAWDARTKKLITGGVLMGVGVGLYAAGSIFGYVRPSYYHKPGSIADPTAWDIGVRSDARGNPAVGITYKMSF
ncbi:MAG: penicillin-binding protein activator LpoB [Treponema sp.]|jgi:TolB-like protein|nr:penicillin-binding protein activator LpoB [Treponema sp.]